MQEINTQFGLLNVVNAPAYSFESKDNVQSYELEVALTWDRLTSIYGIALNGRGIMEVLAKPIGVLLSTAPLHKLRSVLSTTGTLN